MQRRLKSALQQGPSALNKKKREMRNEDKRI